MSRSFIFTQANSLSGIDYLFIKLKFREISNCFQIALNYAPVLFDKKIFDISPISPELTTNSNKTESSNITSIQTKTTQQTHITVLLFTIQHSLKEF